MQRNKLRARFVNSDHQPIRLPECSLEIGERRVDPEDRDVEVVEIDDDGYAVFRPIRGHDRETFRVPCAEALEWQYLGTIADLADVA